MANPHKPPAADDPQHQFLEQMDRELIGWSDPVARLHAALENDELELYCQPMLALRAPGGYPMAEILIRLREEEKAMLPPGEFLPVYEHYGMMPALDRWVVRHALRHRPGRDGNARFSINLSGQTLHDPAFPQYVAARIAEAGVPGDALVFEIDESDMIGSPQEAETFARAIKQAGCGLLFDGFGKRSVSFAPLKTHDFDYVKVDGVIVRQLQKSRLAQSKMNAIVRVGDAIRVGVIAECIEDAGTLAQVRAVGAHFAQGFGIALPQPVGSGAPPRPDAAPRR